jgi:hypothetical protein
MMSARKLRMLFSGLAILLVVCLPAAGRDGDADVPNPASVKVAMAMRDIPRDLQEAWIRFHELELCQSIEAEFIFHRDGMEVRSRADDDSSSQKLIRLLDPLRTVYKISLSEAHIPGVAEGPSGSVLEEVPPSLWNNDKLRLYMRDNFAPTSAILAGKGNEPKESDEVDWLVKQSLAMFSKQTLDWTRRMNRYASDLPLLADAAFNAKLAPELQSRVMEVCIEHTQAMDRLAQRLSGNLVLALPDSPQSFRPFSASEPRAPGKPRPFEELSELSAMAQSIARRIHHFIYPRDFTVSLSDLKKPGLLEALKGLRAKVMIFLQHMVRNGKS